MDRVSSDVTYTYTYAAVSSPTTEPPYIPVPKPGTPEVSNPGYTPSPNIIIHEDSDSGDDDDDDEDTDIDTDEDSDLDEEPSAGSDPNDTNVPEKDTVVYTVIFKVVYGAWNDKTKEDKIVTLEGASGEILYLRQEDIPAVGAEPDTGYKEGAWDTVPTPDIPITSDVVFTYTYTAVNTPRTPTGNRMSPNTSDPFPIIPFCLGGASIVLGIYMLDRKRERYALVFGSLFIASGTLVQVNYTVVPSLQYSEDQVAIREIAAINYENPVKREEYQSAIDFEALQEMNPDIIAWISVDGTDISYPIVKEKIEDEEYYLRHNYMGERSIHGSIFVDIDCDDDLIGLQTVIYGHNMRDGSMFAKLRRFEDKEFFDRNEKIHIYMPDEEKTYTIVGVYSAGIENLMVEYGQFAEDESVNEFINDLTERSVNRREDVELKNDSRYVTLSTCTNQGKRRLLVTAMEDR